MTLMRPIRTLCALACLLAGALFIVRWITHAFGPGSLTPDHPVLILCGALVIAGAAWMAILSIVRKTEFSGRSILASFLLLGFGLRLLFFGSTPVYENDYKRYLWDGSVVASGENPYRFTPAEIFEAGEVGAKSVPDLTRLALRSNEADYFTGEINSPKLTTIYPPAAQAVFTAAYWIAPYRNWGLKLVFLAIELFGLMALLAALRARELPLLWSSAYWLNPIIIFTTYNGMHMDVLLVAPLMASVLWVGRHPIRAALMLSLAAAIKIWPLLLAPVLFRGWRHRPALYCGIAILVGGLTLASLAPMLLSLNSESGLAAYSANWTNSSFLFPGLRDGLGVFFENSDRIARYVIAITLTGLSLWLGFRKSQNSALIPAHLMILSAAFVFLSPTGYPWYFIWFFMFLPFALNHWSARGLALLTIGATAYFARFQIGEAGNYDIYAKILLPLEFGIPLLVLAWDGLRVKRHV
jgi:hypothetical protein